MKKVIILLFVCVSSFSQVKWWYGYSNQASTQWTATFTGYTGGYSPYSASYLYFNGYSRGAFVRHLGSNAMQYMLGLVNATTDSFHITTRFNCSVTARPIMGKLSGASGWRFAIGLNNGASHIEWYQQGVSHNTIDTVSGDTTAHTYEIKYSKANTTLQALVDGVRTVNNTSAVSTVTANTQSFTLGYGNSNNNISDTTQAPSGTGFQGGIYSFSLTRWSGGVDTTYTLIFTGAGDNLYALVTSGGNYVTGLPDFDRADYTDVLNSPHMELGQSPGRDVRNPIWVNTGTRPSFIDTCAGGIAFYQFSASVPNSDVYVESYTNAECLYKTNFTGQAESTLVVVGGLFNTCNVTNYRSFGDSLLRIGKYNINTKKWSSFKNSQYPDNNVTSVYQWDSSLIAGGSFTSFNGVARTNGLARWDGTNWNSLDSGFNNAVVRVRVLNDTLYAGGSFTQSGGTAINRIAKISRGGQWQKFGTGASGEVYDMCIYNNELYIAGYFATANGVTVNGFAKWNGTTFIPFGTGLKNSSGGLGYGFTLEVYNNELYCGGDFDTAGGVVCSDLFKYNGSTITAVGTSITRGAQTFDAVINMAVDSTYNQLWIVGQFSMFNNDTAYCGVVYNGSTFTPLPFQDMRPEGIVIANNQTANIRYFLMGDQMSVYGVNVQNVFELIPTFIR